MSQIYEGMFLVDNQVVREDWRKAKGLVGDLLRKHGGTVQCLRRWDERRLAYPIQGRRRATYFLAYYEMPPTGIDGFRRDMDLSESILRYLLISVPAVPEGEIELAAAEESPDFIVPEPPLDDSPTIEEAEYGQEDEDEPDGEESEAGDSDGQESGDEDEDKVPVAAAKRPAGAEKEEED